jgi:hypothetical protein
MLPVVIEEHERLSIPTHVGCPEAGRPSANTRVSIDLAVQGYAETGSFSHGTHGQSGARIDDRRDANRV